MGRSRPTKSQQKAFVMPTFKKRNLKDCENYRGICLLNYRGICLLNSGYKTFTRIINSKLEAYYRDILGQWFFTRADLEVMVNILRNF
jgi:hypothetical protein